MELWSKELLIKSSPYKNGEVLFESSKAGTYSVDLAASGKYEVYVIGGGGGGATRVASTGAIYLTGGGSGAGFIGVVKLTKGTYPVTVGAGGADVFGGTSSKAGGKSSISDSVIAYGAKSVTTSNSGKGGNAPTVNATIVSTTLNVAGNDGEGKYLSSDPTSYLTIKAGASVYKSYGAGGTTGSGSPQAGKAGYVKIVYVGG